MQQTLHFPPDRICGRLYLQQPAADGPFWARHVGLRVRERHVLADATGVVFIPPHGDKALVLVVNSRGMEDLSFLTALDPDVLDEVVLDGTCRLFDEQDTHLLDERAMASIVHLSGVDRLDLGAYEVRDHALAQLARLPRLRALRLGPVVSDASLHALADLASLDSLELSMQGLTGTGLEALRHLPRLAHLRLTGSDTMTPAGWAALGYCTQIQSLDVSGSNSLTDEAFARLHGLTGLTALDLSGTEINGPGLATLRYFPRLHTLWYDRMGPPERHFRHLRALEHLEDVTCDQTPLRLTAMEDLAHIPRLRRLSLYESCWDRTGIRLLGQATHLEDLNLTGCRVDEASLAAVSQLGRLRSLDLTGADEVTERGVLSLTRLSSLRALSLGPVVIGDTVPAQIARMPHLTDTLSLGVLDMTDRGVAELAALGGLRHLSLYCPAATGSGLRSFHALITLDTLDLSGFTGIQAVDVAFLSELPRLLDLSLSDCAIAAAAWNHVGALRQLRTLGVPDVGLDDATVPYLRTLQALQRLDLSHNPLSTAGARSILPLPALEELEMKHTRVDDGIVDALVQCPRLDTCVISHAQISPAGRQSLQDRLPNCQIIG